MRLDQTTLEHPGQAASAGRETPQLPLVPEGAQAHRRRGDRPLIRAAVIFALALGIGGVLSPWSAADMYRYVDETGVTVYSQSPPPAGDSVRVDAVSGPGEAEASAARERLRGQLEADLDRRLEQQQAAEASAAEENARARAEACQAARGNLATLQSSQATRLRLPDGSTVRPTDAERAELIAETQAQIGDVCD